MFEKLKEKIEKIKRRKIINFLSTADPENIEEIGKKNLLAAFKKSYLRVPAYKTILNEKKINPSQITDIESFKKLVPVIEKKDTFGRFKISDLCVDGNLDEIKSIMSSSGFSGGFSVGVNTKTNHNNVAKVIDMGLQIGFDIDNKKTLLVSTIPMGVKVYTSLTIAETSVREDMALSIIEKFKDNFNQIIIVGDPNFLKRFIEYGIENGKDWKNLNVSLISGEDFFSENMRLYLESLIGADPDKGKFMAATMGIAELDMNIFHETEDTIKLRKLLLKDKLLYKSLFGEEAKIVPLIMHYYPHRTFLESIPQNEYDSELVFSMLSDTMKIPLIRYNSKDCGKIFSYNEIKKILEERGYKDYVPRLKLPIVAMFGRMNKFIKLSGIKFFPEEISEILYSDFDIAKSITGNFVITPNGIDIQLNKKHADIRKKVKKAFQDYKGFSPKIKLYKYYDFPYQMTVDYERKFRHIY